MTTPLKFPVVCPKDWRWLKEGERITGGCRQVVRNSEGVLEWRYAWVLFGSTLTAPNDWTYIKLND